MASRRLLLLPAVIASIAVAAACGNPPGAPSIESITPAEERTDFAGGLVEVTITGSGFHQRIVPDTSDAASSKLARPSVFIGDLVVSSYDGPSQIRAYVDVASLAPGLYDVVVRNPDGSTATSPIPFRVIGPPTQLLVGTGAEPAPGTSNSVTIAFTIADASGSAVPAGAAFDATVVLSTATAIAPAPFTVAAGQSGGSFAVTWNRVGEVEVGLSLSTTSLTVVPGRATFLAGPAARLAIEGTTVVWSSPGTASGTLFVTDADGNVVPAPTAFDANLQEAGTYCGATTDCPGATLQDTVSFAAGDSERAFTATCGTAPPPNRCMPVTIVSVPSGWAGFGTGAAITWTN